MQISRTNCIKLSHHKRAAIQAKTKEKNNWPQTVGKGRQRRSIK